MHRLKTMLSHSSTRSGQMRIMVGDALVRATPKSLIALRQQARTIHLKAVKVISAKSGSYHSPFKGRGMEYEESRLYQSGDDIRNIDWRVTARSGKTYSKHFREERERAVIMWVDYRQSMMFATKGVFKSVMAARAAAVLSWSAVQQGDRVGGLIFDENNHQELRPQNGDKAVLHFIKQLCCFGNISSTDNDGHVQPLQARAKSEKSGDRAEQALVRLRRVSKPGSMVVLISDFRNLGPMAESHLIQLSRHNDVIMLFIFDPLERDLPQTGRYRVSDGSRSSILDMSNSQLRADHHKKFQQHVEYLQSLSRRYGMSLITCATDQAIEQALQQGLRLKRT